MQKTLLASVIVMSLSACDSDSLPLTDDNGTATNAESSVVDATADAATDGTTTDSTADENTTVVVQTPISDDAGSATSDGGTVAISDDCLLYTSPSPRDGLLSRMPSSA